MQSTDAARCWQCVNGNSRSSLGCGETLKDFRDFDEDTSAFDTQNCSYIAVTDVVSEKAEIRKRFDMRIS